MSGDLCVDDDEQFVGVRLPEVFTRPGLDEDEDEDGAACASVWLDAIYDGITHLWYELEAVERALRISEQTSDRAGRTREWVREALGGLEYPVFRGLDEARTILRHSGEYSSPHTADKSYVFTMPHAVNHNGQ